MWYLKKTEYNSFLKNEIVNVAGRFLEPEESHP